MRPEPNRLLLVDDDAYNLDMLSRRLARRGYSIDTAEDGPSALEKINRAQYDLVLLDQMMPGMSGLDLLRLLRATYSQSDLPVIMVTAVDQSQTVVEALDQGANDYVVKPVDVPVITARIDAHLSRLKADREIRSSDALTGLGNRMRLTNSLTGAMGQPRALAVLLLNLDGLRNVNDGIGRAAGDQLLIEVARRLTNVVAQRKLAPSSTITRTGGDEFGIAIERAEDPAQLGELAEALLAHVCRPISMAGMLSTIGASVGIALRSSDHATPEDLLRDAGLALSRAKELGKNCWHMFEPSLRERAQQRIATGRDMRSAVERGELLAVYQPKVDLATRNVAGFEALLRWRHPERGLLQPADFIPLAEETGLIVPMGEWILGAACRQLKSWQSKFPASPPLTMNVNLSVRQLRDSNLVAGVRKILDETGILPGTLKLELTESCLVTEVESAQKVLAELKALPVNLKLDDFGTGYSSLSYLKNLPFDSLKIDRSFVKRLATDSECAAIVETIVNLAHALHMNVVAEGIETESQLAHLVGLGCEAGQGFYFSEPLEAEAAEKLLEAGPLQRAS